MSPRDPDSELARLFGQLRRADEASAPAFRELLARPRARRAVPARAVWRAALTAAAGIAAAAAVVFLLRTPAEPGL
ncbi:MAG: hypothetical protein ACRD1P_08310, partial [Thermoanaerobaculia bacterium]